MWKGSTNVIVCVVNVVLIVEFVVICCCCDCVVHGENFKVLDDCGREHGGCCVVDLVAMFMMRMLS